VWEKHLKIAVKLYLNTVLLLFFVSFLINQLVKQRAIKPMG